jgi:hypothetical protein
MTLRGNLGDGGSFISELGNVVGLPAGLIRFHHDGAKAVMFEGSVDQVALALVCLLTWNKLKSLQFFIFAFSFTKFLMSRKMF